LVSVHNASSADPLSVNFPESKPIRAVDAVHESFLIQNLLNAFDRKFERHFNSLFMAQIEKFFLSFGDENSEGFLDSASAEIFFEGLEEFHRLFAR
jgi:hypothetical protein